MPAGCHGSSPCCRPVLAFAEGSAPGIEDARVAEMRPDLAELCVRTRRRRERPRARGRHGLAKGAGPGAKDGQGRGVGPLLPLPLPPGRGLLGVFWGRFRTRVGRRPPRPVSCTFLSAQTSRLGVRKLTPHLRFCSHLPQPPCSCLCVACFCTTVLSSADLCSERHRSLTTLCGQGLS